MKSGEHRRKCVVQNKSENQQKVRNERIIPIAQNLTKP